MSDIKILLDPSGDESLPIADAVIHDGMLYVSGFVGYRPGTAEVVGDDVESQTLQTLHLIDGVLERAGISRDRLLRMRVYLADVQRDFAAFNQVFRPWIGTHRPARTTVGATLAQPDLLVEIDAQAAL